MKRLIIITLILFGGISFGNAQTLEDYFKIAAEQNPGLQAKYLSFEAAMQKVTGAQSLPDPNLSYGYFVSPAETRVGPQLDKFSLTQMFPWFGTLKAQKDAAARTAEASYQEFINERNRLFYQVSAAYYPLYEQARLAEIEKENLDILTTYKDLAMVKFQNNEGAMVDVLRADILRKDAETNLSILNRQQKSLITGFNKLLNRPEEEQPVIPESLDMTVLEEDYRKDSLISGNPLIEELDLKILAVEASETVAVKQGLPKIGAGLDYVIVGKRTDMEIPDNGKDIFMPMISLSLPIFRSKYKASQAESQLMQESYNLQKTDLENRLISSYETTWFEIQKQEDLIRLYDEQIIMSGQSLNLLLTAYSNSGRDFDDVLSMQQQILKYKKMKVAALTKYHIAVAELEYITAKTR
jgi:outer membrane protein TolC